jgi:hypothetical protein
VIDFSTQRNRVCIREMSDIKDLTLIIHPNRNFQAKTPPRPRRRRDATVKDDPGLSGARSTTVLVMRFLGSEDLKTITASYFQK